MSVFNDIKQFVPSKVCLACEGCCRFLDALSQWRPHLTGAEKEKILSGDMLDKTGAIKTLPSQGTNICFFMDLPKNVCRIYSDRPFECQLYPFVLVRRENQTVVAVHVSCPFVQDFWDSDAMQKYGAYLKEFFSRSDVKDFLRNNPSLFGDYSKYQDELEYVFALDDV